MRNFVIGFIIGALAFSAAPVYGALKSRIGEKIDNEYTVVVDGVELEQKAISVSGTSFTPNRALAEAVGYDVVFRDRKVIFTKKEGGQNVTLEENGNLPRDLTLEESQKLDELVRLQNERKLLVKEIEEINLSMKNIQENILPDLRNSVDSMPKDWVKEQIQREIAMYEAEYEKLQQKLAELEERLGYLDTRIPQLEEETEEYRTP